MEKREKISKLASIIGKSAARRPEVGRFVDISALQRRLAVLFLDADMKDELHFAGWTLGDLEAADKPDLDIKKAVEMLLLKLEEEKFARTELTEVTEKTIRFNLRENANCAGLGGIGMKMCYFEAGYVTGLISKQTGKKIICEEEFCIGQGFDHCGFVIKVL